MFPNVKRDIRRNIATEDVKNFRQLIELFLFNYSLWVILSYRFGRWARKDCRIPAVALLLKIITRLTHGPLCLITGIQIPFETEIGPGLYIGHTGMLVINHDAVIGSDCNIGVGVVIGQAGRGEKKGSPIIGNKVYIGVGAKIIGKITIGDNAAVGANAVVTKDVPSNATVAGIPAGVVNNNGSRDFIRGASEK